MKKIAALILSLVLILSLAGCGATNAAKEQSKDTQGTAQKTPLKVTLPTWTGYGPLFLAQEKGLFKKHGVDVELTIVEGLAERKQALAGGKIDGMATAQDVQVTLAASGVPVQVVWLLDDSYGGDGILVKKEIQSAADLKGKKVAFEVGSTSHLLMLTVLKQAGLTEKDVEVVPMSAGDAGAAFVAGKIDAAVTWEPWLSKGASANGKVLVSTKDLPGIILDSISFRTEVIEKRPDDVKAFVAAMAEAMDYWKANKDESDQIMAKGLKIDLKEFTATVPGLKFLNKEDNQKMFGTSAKQGSIYQATKSDIDFYLEQKLIDKAITPESVINSKFVEGL
ncbi:aliphatic sulfonate ABC transporter substrate-binding protein [Desulfosporosinus fructosivorans]|uniref:Putative aliphatic sulfonates-binding protein n=1 Tax=Desulfosporosinus fructosivorans TaxID=2018669 RepID=A0A4Z0RA50_9FIRM|nr:ABC transporter substrate-binding protein [Desulfosporosinus fructosivorans]TGE39245.1 aliphatic sulfonate ABC transporter substrate-binding protein [Desulfosporosinus fructosivorans]